MPAFDLTLSDPTPAAVARAMADATEAANLRCRVGLLPLDRAGHARFLADDFPAPEGVALWFADQGRVHTFPPTPRGTLLAVAWRTTPLGRTVRVAGRRIEPFNESPSHRFGPPWRQWPPVCHLDPDHVALRTLAGAEPEPLAICPCGAVGPPAKLGWTAGRCGPCHDHAEEHGAPLPAALGPTALRTDGQLIGVGFLPHGDAIAAVEWSPGSDPTWVTTWDCRPARPQPARRGKGRAAPAPRAPAGLALTSGHRAFWVTRANRKRPPSLAGPPSCTAMAFDGPNATAVSYAGAGWHRDLTTDGPWEHAWPERRGARDVVCLSVALAPAGDRVALGWTECTVELLDRLGGARALQPPLTEAELDRQRVHALAFSPDGLLLAAGAGRSGFVADPREQWYGRGGGLYLYDTVKAEPIATFPTPNDDTLAVAFSPDGAFLFAGSTDCTIRVVDVATRQELATLSGHVGGVNALAFSPDGDTLASAGGDGLVRLWPWRQVLAR